MKRLALLGLLGIGLSATPTEDLFQHTLDFQRHYAKYFQQIAGCPDPRYAVTADIDFATCNPTHGCFDRSAFLAAREEAKELFELDGPQLAWLEARPSVVRFCQ